MILDQKGVEKHAGPVTGEERARRLGQKPVTVVVGDAGTASALERRLFDQGHAAFVLTSDPSRIATEARLLNDAGLIAIVVVPAGKVAWTQPERLMEVPAGEATVDGILELLTQRGFLG